MRMWTVLLLVLGASQGLWGRNALAAGGHSLVYLWRCTRPAAGWTPSELFSVWVHWITNNRPSAMTVKNPPAMGEIWVWSLGWEDPLEKGMATHSSILAWRIPWTEEPGGLQSMGWRRAGYDWATDTHTHAMNLGSWGTVYKSHILSKFDTLLFLAFKI